MIGYENFAKEAEDLKLIAGILGKDYLAEDRLKVAYYIENLLKDSFFGKIELILNGKGIDRINKSIETIKLKELPEVK